MIIVGDLDSRSGKSGLNGSHCGRWRDRNSLDLTGVHVKSRRVRTIYRTSRTNPLVLEVVSCRSLDFLLRRKESRQVKKKKDSPLQHASKSFLLETDSHLTSNPFTALFPASSSNLDHKVYVYIYIQAWTDITAEPRHRNLPIHRYIPIYTGYTWDRSRATRGNTGDFHGRGSREMRGSRGRKFGASTAR